MSVELCCTHEVRSTRELGAEISHRPFLAT